MPKPRLGERRVPYAPGSPEHLAHVSATARYAHDWPEGPTAHVLIAWLYGVSDATAHRYLAEARAAHPDTPRMRRPRTPTTKEQP